MRFTDAFCLVAGSRNPAGVTQVTESDPLAGGTGSTT
jgi:hypothetical protein